MGLFRSRRDLTVDVAIAVAVGVVSLTTAAASEPETGARWWGYAALLVGAAALIARRRAPRVVLVLTTASVVAHAVIDQPGLSGVAVLVAIYTAVDAGHRWTALAVVGGGLATSSALTVATGGSLGRAMADTVLLKGWLLASGVLAEVVRKQRDLAEAAERRAEAAEAAREEAALRRADEERVRIARELHDSLTHSIAVIAVQANVAVHLAGKRGEEVPPALVAIQEASREAAEELRSTLDVLRRDGTEGVAGGGGGGAGRHDLGDVPGLVEGAARAGVAATLTVSGAPGPVPAEVGAAAYRIVQEALTNVARHAGPVPATVRVTHGAGSLTVEVDDDGPVRRTAVRGHGLGITGMRERAVALGGSLDAGPRPGGGFRVRAVLRFQAGPSPADAAPDGEAAGGTGPADPAPREATGSGAVLPGVLAHEPVPAAAPHDGRGASV